MLMLFKSVSRSVISRTLSLLAAMIGNKCILEHLAVECCHALNLAGNSAPCSGSPAESLRWDGEENR